MRAAALCALLYLASCESAVGQTFPYTATTTMATPVRSDASEANEPTATLPSGTAIEVHRHDGPWLAVRPPQGSFSWVRASDVERSSRPGIVRVVHEGADSWIGHQGSNLRSARQVTLKQGELLRVLQSPGVAPGSDPSQARWYKISPPAGEFRFVHSRYISPQSKPEATAAETVSWSTRGDQPQNQPPQAVAGPPAAMPQATAPPVGQATPVAAASFQTPIASASQPAAPVALAAFAPSASVMPPSVAAAVTQRLDQIDRQISGMLAHSPTVWNTTAVAAELRVLAATAPTPQLQTRAQSMWTKIANCQQIQQGYAQLASGTFAAQTTPGQPTPSPAARAAYTAAADPPGNPFQLATAYPSPTAESNKPLMSRIRRVASNVGEVAQNVTYAVTPNGSMRNYGRKPTHALPASTIPPAATIVAQASAAEDENPTYAGTGWLMPLVARSQMPRDFRDNVPPYALTDDQGNVLHLVTPTPGLSLTPYARKQVGVIGTSGQLPGLNNPHIVAQRVVVLEREEETVTR